MKFTKVWSHRVSPAAEIVPPSRNYERIKRSIEAHGLFHPIILHDGEIVDGRARYMACVELGLESSLRFVDMDVDKWKCQSLCALHMNAVQRDFTESQRFLMYKEFAEQLEVEVETGEYESTLQLIRSELGVKLLNRDLEDSSDPEVSSFLDFEDSLPHLTSEELDEIRNGEDWRDIIIRDLECEVATEDTNL